MKKEYGENINFKHWLSRTIIVSILLFTLVGIIDRYLGWNILVTTMLAITIMLIIMFLHEFLHYYQAKKLGYEVIWWRTKWRFGFDTDTDKKQQWRLDQEKNLSIKQRKQRNVSDVRKIATLPYYVIIPLSISIIILGFTLKINGIYYAGIASILLHVISYKKEGALSE